MPILSYYFHYFYLTLLIMPSVFISLCLFQGYNIHKQALDSFPLFMTVIDLSSGSGWEMCVTLWEKSEIALLGVTPKGVKIMASK